MMVTNTLTQQIYNIGFVKLIKIHKQEQIYNFAIVKLHMFHR